MYSESTKNSIYKYRAKHIDKIKEDVKNYQILNADKLKQYRIDNADIFKNTKAKWFKEHYNDDMRKRLNANTKRYKDMKKYFSYELVAKSFLKITI